MEKGQYFKFSVSCVKTNLNWCVSNKEFMPFLHEIIEYRYNVY